jgi:hypothetical protein
VLWSCGFFSVSQCGVRESWEPSHYLVLSIFVLSPQCYFLQLKNEKRPPQPRTSSPVRQPRSRPASQGYVDDVGNNEVSLKSTISSFEFFMYEVGQIQLTWKLTLILNNVQILSHNGLEWTHSLLLM